MPPINVKEFSTNNPVPFTWNDTTIIPRIGEGIYDCQSGRSWNIKDVIYYVDKGEIYEITLFVE